MFTNNFLQTLLRVLLSALLVGGMTITAVNAVDGNPPGLFELDGNTVDDLGGGDDWDGLYTSPPGSSVAFTTILADPSPLTIFTGGGSKDILDIPNWAHTTGNVPDKDDITNAYAAAYINPSDVSHGGEVLHQAGDMIIYFGLDRFANNGDAHAGFWFFQDEVGLGADGKFVGQHAARDDAAGKRGDLLVLMGELSNDSARVRTRDIEEVLATRECAGMKILDKREGKWSRTQGQDITMNWLSSGMKFDAIIANNDEMAIGAINALKSARKWTPDMIVAGIDATPDGLASMKNGDLKVSVFQNLAGQGANAVDAALRLAGKQAVERFVNVPFELVTPENMDQYARP